MTVSMGLMMQDDDVSNCINSQKEIITATVTLLLGSQKVC